MATFFLWLVSVVLLLNIAGIGFWAGRVSQRIECSAKYRQEMWRPFGKFSSRTITAGGLALELLVVVFFTAPYFRSPSLLSSVNLVVVSIAMMIYVALLIAMSAHCELYARCCDWVDARRQGEASGIADVTLNDLYRMIRDAKGKPPR